MWKLRPAILLMARRGSARSQKSGSVLHRRGGRQGYPVGRAVGRIHAGGRRMARIQPPRRRAHRRRGQSGRRAKNRLPGGDALPHRPRRRRPPAFRKDAHPEFRGPRRQRARPASPPRCSYGEYSRMRDKGNHIVVKPGDNIPIKGLDVQIVSADGDLIDRPCHGAGQPNPIAPATRRPRRTDRKRPLHRDGRDLRQFPRGGPGRPHQGQGIRPGVSQQQARHGGSVHGVAPWLGPPIPRRSSTRSIREWRS